MTAIIVLLVATAAISLALHAMLRRFVPAVLATAVLMDGLLLLLRVQGPWKQSDTQVMLVAAAIAMAVSACVGAPLAVARRRRENAARGFEVMPPGHDR